MTHPESGVLDAIAELEAEEAAQPRRPWWTSYEEAAERGAVIAVSPPSPHVLEAEGMLPRSASFVDAVNTSYGQARWSSLPGGGTRVGGVVVHDHTDDPWALNVIRDQMFSGLGESLRELAAAVDVPLEQREDIRRLQFANERVRRLREGRLRDVVITNNTRRAREYCRRNGIPAPGLPAPYMANRPDKLRGLDLMNCRLHEVFSPGNSAMREWDQLSAMLRAYAGYAGYPLGWFYGSAGVGEPDRRGGGEGQT